MIPSVADAVSDLARAPEWLGEWLGISGVVMPATAEAVSLVGDAGGELVQGEAAIGEAHTRTRSISFVPERPEVPAVPEAIAQTTSSCSLPVLCSLACSPPARCPMWLRCPPVLRSA
jgi:2-phospho-L-lactate transferase/gluconeogenesis factor (CofD/UPF0052 family)